MQNQYQLDTHTTRGHTAGVCEWVHVHKTQMGNFIKHVKGTAQSFKLSTNSTKTHITEKDRLFTTPKGFNSEFRERYFLLGGGIYLLIEILVELIANTEGGEDSDGEER